MRIVTITGHRPRNLPCYYDENHQWCIDLKKRIKRVLRAYNSDTIIRTGMALGFDTWVAEQCLTIEIEIQCFIPCLEQSDIWPQQSRDRYKNILTSCINMHGKKNVILCYNGTYKQNKGCMNQRNSYMLNGIKPIYHKNQEAEQPANEILALWNGKEYGGTYDTIFKARNRGLPVTNLYK